MQADEPEVIEVRVIGARAQHEAIAFTHGVATNPFTVGTNGQWAIQSDGVGPVHLYLGFDGQRVLVAAIAAALPVQIAGAVVSGGWATVPVPGEIRLGAARLVVRRTRRSALPPGAQQATPSTMSDGGALYKAAQRAVHAAHVGPPGHVGGSTGPPAEIHPKQFASTMVMEQRPLAQESMPPPPTGVTGGSRPSTSGPPRPAAGAPPLFSDPPPPPVEEPLAGPPADEDGTEPEKKKNYWQQASPVKKASLVLMPLALVFAYLMLTDDARPPAKVIVASDSSARRAARDAGAATVAAGGGGPSAGATGAGTTATPGGAGAAGAAGVTAAATAAVETAEPGRLEIPPTYALRPRTPLAPLKAGKKTPEREAIDTVAAGAFDDAARQYEALAVAHPDDPSFKEAARILHIKGGHVH